MNASDYQSASDRTLILQPDREIPNDDLCRVVSSIKVASKYAAITEYLKKGIFHQHGVNYGRIIKMSQDAENEKWRDDWDVVCIPQSRVMPLWALSGLVGEAGEIAELVIKYCVTGEVDKERLKDELGDLMWYVSSLCTLFGLNLGDVMEHNVAKLQKRYPNGYRAMDSINRGAE